MIKFGLNSVYGQKYFQEFSILGGVLGIPPPLAIPAFNVYLAKL